MSVRTAAMTARQYGATFLLGISVYASAKAPVISLRRADSGGYPDPCDFFGTAAFTVGQLEKGRQPV
jgi:hypothetical protein